MKQARKLVLLFMAVCILLSLYGSVMNYIENGNDFERDPKVVYEIYDDLPIPDKTQEIEKKESIRERSSVSLDVYYHTNLSNEQIRQFYIRNLPDKGWIQIEDQGGDGIAFKKGKWKIAVHDDKDKYRVDIYKIYRY